MAADELADRLTGGSPGSLGGTDAVVQDLLADPARASGLWDAVRDEDPVVRARAVDALEKVSRTHPEVVHGRLDDVLALAGSDQAAVRWHVGPLLARVDLDRADDRRRAARVLDRLLSDPSRIAQALALDGLVQLADRHPDLADAADAALSAALESPYPSVSARARRLLR